MKFFHFLFHLLLRIGIVFGLIALIAYSLWWVLERLLLEQ